MPQITDDLEALVRTMVDVPDDVEAHAFESGRTTELELSVAPDDLGKVIGRQGRTARAMRTLLTARGECDDANYELTILEEDD